MRTDRTMIIVVAAIGCFVVGCVTLLAALGKDSSPVTYLLAVVVPTLVGNLASLRASNRAKNAAETAAETSLSAAEQAANQAAVQATLRAEVTQLQARIGGRRADDRR